MAYVHPKNMMFTPAALRYIRFANGNVDDFEQKLLALYQLHNQNPFEMALCFTYKGYDFIVEASDIYMDTLKVDYPESRQSAHGPIEGED